jgi:putative SOS response-associated peptidase YedK
VCTRYTLSAAEKSILAAYAAELVDPYIPNYNLAPTQNGLVITADEPGLIQYMNFGIVPHFSHTGKADFDSFNSRDDRLLESKTWKPLVTHHKT